MDKYKEITRCLRELAESQAETEYQYGVDANDMYVVWQAANAIEELLNVKLHESCTDCPLYDKDNHRCPRFNAVIPTAIEDALAELPSAQPESEGRAAESAQNVPSDELISKKAAIDALAKEMPSLTTPDGSGEFDHDIQITDEAFVDCMQIINGLPSTQRWIPVSERPPEDLQEVVVTWINREYAPIKDIPQTGCAVYYGGCWYWSSATCIEILKEYGKNDIDLIDHIIEIIAWQELPEPYGGEE